MVEIANLVLDGGTPLAYILFFMKDELFNELVASVREGGKILRGKAQPSRTFVIEAPDVKEIRANYKLSQNEFAALM